MPSAPLRLSKSRFVAGVQCHKQLWWRVHEPDAPELVPEPALRNRFDQGAEVGRVARGYVPGGELIDLPFYQYDNKVAATRDSLRRDPPPGLSTRPRSSPTRRTRKWTSWSANRGGAATG